LGLIDRFSLIFTPDFCFVPKINWLQICLLATALGPKAAFFQKVARLGPKKVPFDLVLVYGNFPTLAQRGFGPKRFLSEAS
jgi:hypothetical protein